MKPTQEASRGDEFARDHCIEQIREYQRQRSLGMPRRQMSERLAIIG
jgi:hypothetical protein